MDDSIVFSMGCIVDGKLPDNWPRNEKGESESPVFLCRCTSVDLIDVLRVNMLEAYGIPCVRTYPESGDFGRIVLGMSGFGTNIFIPESMYEDALALCEEENSFDEEL